MAVMARNNRSTLGVSRAVAARRIGRGPREHLLHVVPDVFPVLRNLRLLDEYLHRLVPRNRMCFLHGLHPRRNEHDVEQCAGIDGCRAARGAARADAVRDANCVS